MKTQKSKLYNKYRASKYEHKTQIIRGSGNVKGKLIPGYLSAQHEVEARIGRPLKLHHREENRGQWIFCELK